MKGRRSPPELFRTLESESRRRLLPGGGRHDTASRLHCFDSSRHRYPVHPTTNGEPHGSPLAVLRSPRTRA
jgi:hypothetical protein